MPLILDIFVSRVKSLMFCPTCSTQNLPTSVHCTQCGTSLIGSVVGGSDTYRKHARILNVRMYAGAGGVIAFAFAMLLGRIFLSDMNWDDRQIYGGASVFALIGAAVGRFIANRQI